MVLCGVRNSHRNPISINSYIKSFLIAKKKAPEQFFWHHDDTKQDLVTVNDDPLNLGPPKLPPRLVILRPFPIKWCRLQMKWHPLAEGLNSIPKIKFNPKD